jgi:hypothetical protein
MCANIMSQISTGKSQESLCPRLDFPDNEEAANWGGLAQFVIFALESGLENFAGILVK